MSLQSEPRSMRFAAADDKLWSMIAAVWNRTPTAALATLPCAAFAFVVLSGLGQKSLWLDEAWVANLILNRDFSPSSLQTTPIGFAASVSVAIALLGDSDYVLRLIPATFGIGAVLLAFFLAHSLARSRLAGFCAASLLAVNLPMIVYSKTLKPYTADMFFAILMLILGERLVRSDMARNWVVYVLAVFVALTFSFASIFTAVVCAIVLLWASFARHDLQAKVRWALSHGVIAIGMGLYAISFLLAQRSPGLVSMWDTGYPPGSGLIPIIRWYVSQSVDIARFLFVPEGSTTGYFAAWCALVGAYTALRRQPRHVLLLVGPLGLVALASVASVYPFDGRTGGRLLLFTLPGLVALAAIGLSSVVRVSYAARLAGVGVLLIAVTFAPGLRTVRDSLSDPLMEMPDSPVQETRALLTQDLVSELRSDDMIYVYYGAAYALQRYVPESREGRAVGWGERRTVSREGVSFVFGGEHRGVPGAYSSELLTAVRIHSPARLWIVISHYIVTEESELLAAASEYGVPELDKRDRGARLLRYRPSAAVNAGSSQA